MTDLADTTVLVAAVSADHPDHLAARAWMEKVQRTEIKAVVCAHSLAEMYSVLTRLPVEPRVSPAQAHRVIKADILPHVTMIELSVPDYLAAIAHLAGEGIGGGRIYDAIIAIAAVKAQVDRLVTFNVRHFETLHPYLTTRVSAP